jgi:hypothetical protein
MHDAALILIVYIVGTATGVAILGYFGSAGTGTAS